MSNCPVCEAPVTADFGLIECESCGVQLLVHVDGRVEHQGAEGKQVLGAPKDEEKPPAIAGTFREVTRTGKARAPTGEVFFADQETKGSIELDRTGGGSFADFLSEEAVNEEPAFDAAPAADAQDEPYFGGVPSGAEAAPPEDAPASGEIGDLGDLFGEEPPEKAAEQAEEVLADFSAPEEAPAPAELPPLEYNFDEPGGGGEPPPPVYMSAPAPDSPDLSDVARFGNSDISGGRDGALRYTLYIEGIDTADVRAAFREAITDRKFVWDIDAILRGVRNGEVKIQNVAPSKAYILISRLRGLPVKVRWEQYALSQT